MTAKQELKEYIQNLTPEQMENVISRLDLLGKYLNMTDAQQRIVAGYLHGTPEREVMA